jgi:hypothetical protein
MCSLRTPLNVANKITIVHKVEGTNASEIRLWAITIANATSNNRETAAIIGRTF